MDIQGVVQDKTITAKQKTQQLAQALQQGALAADELVAAAKPAKPPVQALLLETAEHATAQNPSLASPELFAFAANCLSSAHGGVQREAARLIGNTAPVFPGLVETAVPPLLRNAKEGATVVRWSAAFALAQIAKLAPYAHDSGYQKALRTLLDTEEKASIQKIYRQALQAGL